MCILFLKTVLNILNPSAYAYNEIFMITYCQYIRIYKLRMRYLKITIRSYSLTKSLETFSIKISFKPQAQKTNSELYEYTY